MVTVRVTDRMANQGSPRSFALLSNRSLLIFTVVGVFIYILLDAIAQMLPPYYSLGQAESLLAVGPYGYIMTINFIVRGLLSTSFIFGFVMMLNPKERPGYSAGLVLIGVWGVMAFVLAAFPADPSSAISTAHGRIHDLAAFIAFLCGGFGALLISLRMTGQGMLGLRKIALPIGATSALLSVATILIIPLFPGFSEKYWGIVERIFIGSVLLWILIVSSYLLVQRSRSMTMAN